MTLKIIPETFLKSLPPKTNEFVMFMTRKDVWELREISGS